MATQLRIKRGTTNANAPSGLTAGEMAINLVDKKLYVGGTAGTNVIFLDSTSSVGLSTANTFTQLNTFSAGISASGATFTGSISGATATFSKDITVNSMTVGLGSSSDTTNVAIGYAALASNTSDQDQQGVSNVAVGGSALTTNTTGAYNTAIGYGALSSNTSGTDNIAIGYGALTNSSTASFNIAIGINALALGSLGDSNIGVGFETLGAAGNTGNSNVAVGYQSLKANTAGVNNVGMGYQSLFSATGGSDNTGIGTNTLRALTTGSNNTGVGGSALRVLSTASQMTALGNNAGRYRGTGTATITTGTGGIYIGYQARGSTLAQTNEIVIGVDALGLGSNTAVIGATLQSAATIYGVLNLPGGLSTTGATFSAPITSTRMARHTSAAISAQKTVDFTPTTAEDGTVFYINYSGKGSVTVTLDGLPIGWRAKFLNVGSGAVYFTSTGDIYGEGSVNLLGTWLMEAICIDTNTYFIG